MSARRDELVKTHFEPLVRRLVDEVNKRQYWNALIILLELQKLLSMAFDDVLKGRS